MWASNGDAISRQYAGTAAMKVQRGKTLFPFIFMHLGIVNIQPRSQSISSYLPLKRGTRQTLRTKLINICFLSFKLKIPDWVELPSILQLSAEKRFFILKFPKETSYCFWWGKRSSEKSPTGVEAEFLLPCRETLLEQEKGDLLVWWKMDTILPTGLAAASLWMWLGKTSQSNVDSSLCSPFLQILPEQIQSCI